MTRPLYAGTAVGGESAFERILSRLRDHGSVIEEQRPGDVVAQCPAHPDGRPSLHITDGDDRILVHCFAACDTDDVLGALGLTRDDLFNQQTTNYPYRDRTGTVVRTVTRRPGKRITQSGNTKGVAPLYRLPEVIAAVEAGRTIYLVEGEPDVHAWVRRGIDATTAPQGARNVDKADFTPLTGANVIAVVDRDDSGDAWAQKVQDLLTGVAASLVFKRAKVGKDSSDHLAAGYGAEDLEPYLLPNPLLDLIRTGTWLDQQDFRPLVWVIPEVIPEGFGLITGPPKVGKSWLTLDIALSVAIGRRALGRIPLTGSRPVLLLALEDSHRRMQSRTRILMRDEALPDNFQYAIETPPGQTFTLIQQWLQPRLDQQPVVILDTLGKVMPDARQGESQYQRDYRIGSALKSLATDGVSILVVHHTRKSESGDWMESTSGTNGLNGAADFTLNLSRERNAPVGIIRVTGRDVNEGEYEVLFNGGNWWLNGMNLQQASEAAEATQAQRKARRHATVEVPQVVESDPESPICITHRVQYDAELGCAFCRVTGNTT